jgi:sodium-dependent phosphate transporter
MIDDVEHYTWIVVLGFFASFYAAFGIGANDVANAFATSVGSKALTIKQACFIAVICESLGAILLGGEVVKTIRKGIADENAFADNPPLLMWGCLCTLISVGTWLISASKFEMPVSTTHSCVGGMIGMTIALRGTDSVVWYKSPTEDKPLPGGFLGVVLSWFISPVLSATVASSLFVCVRCVLRSKRPFENAFRIYPILVFGCITTFTLFMLMKGIKSIPEIKALSDGVKVAISFGVGATMSLLSYPLYKSCKYWVEHAQEKANSDIEETATNATDPIEIKQSTQDTNITLEPKQSRFSKIKSSLSSSMNTNIHDAVEDDKITNHIHKNAEVFDKKAELMFTYLQVFSACFDALAHGANDVANAVGPFATIFLLYNGSEVGSKQDMGEHKWWILGLGGIGIACGLLIYGSQILRAIGVKLAVITPSRGFCIETGSSIIVILGAYFGLPLSTTHCQIGATMGVALLEGVRGFNKRVILKTVFGWIFTCVFVGFMSAIIASIGAYAPTSRDICQVNATIQ